ncbi:MAG: polyprenol monophosphomannose synthase [Candidatus Sumerlaeaceae bacterium]|nr:polyprenol monophosphomannose synthase [Candidatus Sumerlaeaceae bacterium]
MGSSCEKTCIVLATYNEASNLQTLLPALRQILPDGYVIVVDDNSPDGTPQLLEELARTDSHIVPVIRAGKQGYGSAVLAGFQRALEMDAQCLVTLDADFSHDPAAIPSLLAALAQADIAIGSRYYQGVRVLNWHVSRLLLSLFANRYVRAILGIPVADATSGYRAYRRGAVEAILTSRIDSQGYSFLVEILYRAYRRGMRIVEVPIIYSERREGQSKMSKGVIFEAMIRPWLLRFGRQA